MAYRESLWQAGGYRSYYDYRVHDYGRIPADRPALGGEARAIAEGHRGPAELSSAISLGRVSGAFAAPGERRPDGTLRFTEVQVITKDGQVRIYRVPTADKRASRNLARRLDRRGIPFRPGYGLPKIEHRSAA